MPTHSRRDQDGWSSLDYMNSFKGAAIIKCKHSITSFWHNPSHCMQVSKCHCGEGGDCLPVHAPDFFPSRHDKRQRWEGLGRVVCPHQSPQQVSTHFSEQGLRILCKCLLCSQFTQPPSQLSTPLISGQPWPLLLPLSSPLSLQRNEEGGSLLFFNMALSGPGSCRSIGGPGETKFHVGKKALS